MCKKKIVYYYAFVICAFLLSAGCKKEVVTAVQVESSKVKGTITPQFFDWETVDKVPTGPDVNINMPWAGSNGLFDPQITYDFKRRDGWKMVYNTFRTDQIFQNGHYFALYNKYRGVLRFYFYIRPNNNLPSTYLEENFVAFSPSGKTTSFWNFANVEVIDPATNSMQSRAVRQFALPSDGAWYVSEFDVAYDPDLKNLSYTDIWLLNDLKFWSVEKTSLSGTISGTATNITVSTPKPLTVSNLLAVASPRTVVGLVSSLTDSGRVFKQVFKDEVAKVASGGAGALVRGISNLIFTGSPFSGSTQTHSKIQLSGNFTGQNVSNGAVKENFKIAMPSTSNATSGDGPVPFDNEPMGIYNLPSRPLVKVKSSYISPSSVQCLYNSGMTNNSFEYTFYFNDEFLNSLCPAYPGNVYNPKFLEVASLTYGYSYNGSSYTTPKLEILVGTYYDDLSGYQIVGKKDCSSLPNESIGGITMKSITPSRAGVSGGIIGNGTFRSNTPVYLRISFDVVPKDGSPRTTVIKTFKCDVSSYGI